MLAYTGSTDLYFQTCIIHTFKTIHFEQLEN